jgi:murein DD-endopeptidase MepM/ murein hydrolase activator NlpD
MRIESTGIMNNRTMGGLAIFLGLVSAALAVGRVEISWPTPNRAWAEGRPLGDYLQQAGSGKPESGGFGGVRNGGTRFHEGIDIKPVSRDRRGEPADAVFAAMDGVVRHISANPGKSSYGRYIVVEHPAQTPAVYTLYAHLSRIAPGVKAGDAVRRGETIGTMGHSAGGYTIPRSRAHLHFEIGLMMTTEFQAWYDAQKFGSPNDHGIWNGLNLAGIDPLDFLNAWRARRVNTFADYFARMRPAVRLRLATRRTPDFVRRYPGLLTKSLPAAIGGWEIAFNWTGLPFAWTPLTPLETMGLVEGRPVLLQVDGAIERRERSRTLAVERRGRWTIDRDLETVLAQLFGHD